MKLGGQNENTSKVRGPKIDFSLNFLWKESLIFVENHKLIIYISREEYKERIEIEKNTKIFTAQMYNGQCPHEIVLIHYIFIIRDVYNILKPHKLITLFLFSFLNIKLNYMNLD